MIWKHGFLHSEVRRMGDRGFGMMSVRESSRAKPLFIERGFFI
jgi:hypothetical protein